jgi:hypothetical protein
MLQITVQLTPEMWDEEKEEFIPPKTQELQLEHSLVSLKKWESKWCKPFLSKKEKTTEETIDYIKHMTLTRNVDPDVYNHLSQKNIDEINDYILAPMTATTFSDEPRKSSRGEQITAELIYYWMSQFNLPSEYQKWHLNSLLTLIRVCTVKNSPPKKRSKQDTARHYAEMNAARRKKYNSKG